MTKKKTAANRKAAPKQQAVKLLSGGNPQIAKADGEAAVQAYLKAIPGWKRDVSRRVDAIITRTVPRVRKAVKWNSPFYGAGNGWFVSFHMFTNYVKITFFNGASLMPPPPVGSKHKDVRYCHIHEGDSIDESQLTSWIRQSSTMPGWMP